jgi:hypothetical protein
MSVYLIYFEKKRKYQNGNYNDVNKFVVPNLWTHDDISDVSVIHQNKKIKARIFFDGITSGDFYFFGRDSYGLRGLKFREVFYDFISSRLSNPCVCPFIYLNVFSGDDDFDNILLPDMFSDIVLKDLDMIFKNRVYVGFFCINRFTDI